MLGNNLENRAMLTERLRAELVGPDPVGEQRESVPASMADFAAWREFRKTPFTLKGEEVLVDSPLQRYGAGMLYPLEEEPVGDVNNDAYPQEATEVEVDDGVETGFENDNENREIRKNNRLDDVADNNLSVTVANRHKPSAMGISLYVDLSKISDCIAVELASVSRCGSTTLKPKVNHSGMYQRHPIAITHPDPGKKYPPKAAWSRYSLADEAGSFPWVSFTRNEFESSRCKKRFSIGGVESGILIDCVSRQLPADKGTVRADYRLITFTLMNTNRVAYKGDKSVATLFQAGIKISCRNLGWLQPYPSFAAKENPSSEEAINNLLYRHYKTWAVGHGCSADWYHANEKQMPGDDSQVAVEYVFSDSLPLFETPNTSADMLDPGSKKPLKFSMHKLAGLDDEDNGLQNLDKLTGFYETWIASLKQRMPEGHAETAELLIARCKICLDRIKKGMEYLTNNNPDDEPIRQAFRMANESMLLARFRAKSGKRPLSGDGDNPVIEAQFEYEDYAIKPNEQQTKGFWRPFQIAFLLMNIAGVECESESERDLVDVIWFPTGGGKTEAYLGLTAFTIFLTRLREDNKANPRKGMDVLMRYTLRLLTTQQFERAALLILSMNSLRMKKYKDELGGKPFTIGMWVGSASTPNNHDDAESKIKEYLQNSWRKSPFPVLKCPWCHAEFGKLPSHGTGAGRRGRANGVFRPFGYKMSGGHFILKCPDNSCDFGGLQTDDSIRLPILIVDEDLYTDPPNLLIGTVDKFAQVVWKDEVGRLFGIFDDTNGIADDTRKPPALIIQDELHLIAGALGSIQGFYEILIDQLCERGGYRPKIIASTATISRAADQVASLYAREMQLFPPAGLEAGESFFATIARDENGNQQPGRLYAGVFAPFNGSMQTTQARIYATLLHYPKIVSDDSGLQDPWWTLLCFYNSLRELGGASTLFAQDVMQYMAEIRRRTARSDTNYMRRIYEPEELTSRIDSSDVPEMLAMLERKYQGHQGNRGDVRAVDVCLASNIIEVGVDISRLAVMALIGQPKTTAQYIQVSSRIGRDKDRPGLVVMLYDPSRSRDRSHFEHFRPYHERLYSQVEPTSVTPFSPPVVDRCLAALWVGYLRQARRLDSPLSYYQKREEGTSTLKNAMSEMLKIRLKHVTCLLASGNDDVANRLQGEQWPYIEEKMESLFREMESWNKQQWGMMTASAPDHLIYSAGSKPSNSHMWPVMTSLRNVDATCGAEISAAGFYYQMENNNG